MEDGRKELSEDRLEIHTVLQEQLDKHLAGIAGDPTPRHMMMAARLHGGGVILSSSVFDLDLVEVVQIFMKATMELAVKTGVSSDVLIQLVSKMLANEAVNREALDKKNTTGVVH